ncbi:MAG: transcription-repair coupling factor [Lewinellaceae bacterium]|nr:transcription-repair coupling factor [Lewinellaceae bacterium]
METLQQLLDRYRADQRVQELASRNRKRTLVRGVKGSQDCFLLAGAQLARPGCHLFVAGDKEEAAYLQNTLAGLLQDQHVGFFPDSFKRPLYFEALDSNNTLQRTETVNQLSHAEDNGAVVVTYPEALFEKVVAPDILEKSRLEIAVGELLDVDSIVEILVEYGFSREEFVYEPGQFSIRGGIVDIYSYGNEYPYRIELFDLDVESIRTFDPLTQLSVRNISKVSIVPNINTRFRQDQKVSLFQVLPVETLIWIRDFQLLLDRIQKCFDRAGQFAENLGSLPEEELSGIFNDRAFIRPHEVMEDIGDRPLVLFSDTGLPFTPDKKLEFSARPQPSFNKQFSLLLDHLNDNGKKGIDNFIFTDNPKQLERFQAIFRDLGAKANYNPVLKAIHQGFIDEDLKVACYTDHQIFERFHRYKLRQGFTKDQAVNLRMLRELEPGDFVVHIDHGIGRFSGLQKMDINGHIQESVRIIYQNNDILYVSVNSLHKISKYTGKDGQPPRLSKLGSDAWANLKRRTKSKVKDIAGELIKLYAKRKASPGHAFPPDGYLQNELEASFIYEDTPDQLKATQEVKEDMMKAYPMDRLICGDVGFGKTEVAIRAAFKSVADGKQVAVLVPTTILALQHNRTFSERLGEFGIKIDYVNRFRTAAERRQIFKDLKEGKIEIVIGTHGLLNQEVGFKDLGLLIIDEEQKFGVAAKEKLRNLKVNVDTLTLTATPIPRTLQFSLMAARDLSIIRTPPPNRQPIHTEVRIFSEEVIREAIYYEINRGGQVFFVHNRVKTLPDVMALVQRLCPDVNIAMAHGQMDPKKLEETLIDYIDRRFEVLICTNIIETGLDIPNANTMIIMDANNFGLSDLHQLRGRVGRSNKRAFCYLFAPPLSVLTPEARKRLKTIEEFSDLGSGFDIAMRDLDIRGAGNLLGAEQSGFITDIGYETYQKILEEAIQELKENEFKDVFEEELSKQQVFVRDVQIDTDAEMLIPEDFVENIQERLRLYTQLDELENEEALSAFETGLRDRFGRIPRQVNELFEGLRLRWVCKQLGFERVLLKGGKLRCYFVLNPQSKYYESPVFKKIFQYVGQHGKNRGLSLKQSAQHLIMVKDDVRDIREASALLKKIEAELE